MKTYLILPHLTIPILLSTVYFVHIFIICNTFVHLLMHCHLQLDHKHLKKSVLVFSSWATRNSDLNVHSRTEYKIMNTCSTLSHLHGFIIYLIFIWPPKKSWGDRNILKCRNKHICNVIHCDFFLRYSPFCFALSPMSSS